MSVLEKVNSPAVRFLPNDILRGFAYKTEKKGIRLGGELPRDTYLSSLDVIDSEHVEDFVSFANILSDSITIPGIKFGVIAVGSTVRPLSERHRPPRNINLRLLMSSPRDEDIQNYVPDPTDDDKFLGLQGKVIRQVRDLVIDNYHTLGISLRYDRKTKETYLVLGNNFDENGIHFIQQEAYENSPSFTLQYESGLPLQIIVSGVGSYPLRQHLALERASGGNFSQLFPTKSPIKPVPQP